MKKNKTVVFISAYSYPELISSEYLSLDIMTQCVRAGFNVVRITPNQVRGISNTERKKYKKTRTIIEKDWTHKIINCFSFAERHFFFRMIRYFSFGAKTIKFLKSQDIFGIFVWSYPPLGFTKAIAKYASRNKIPLIMDVHDIQPEILKTNILVKALIKKSTDYVLNKASYVLTLSEDMKDTLMDKGVYPNKITVIHPWDEMINKAANIPTEILEKAKNKYVVGYVGNIGSFQNIELLIETAKTMSDNVDVLFLFVGNGAKANLVKKESSKNHNILYYEKVDPEIAYSLYAFVDINIISLKNGLIKYACPSKTPIILEANKNTLLLLNQSKYSEELILGGAVLNDSFSVLSIKNTILKMKNNEVKGKLNCKIDSYNREYCLKQWYDFFIKFQM